jgi:hypothetical protein
MGPEATRSHRRLLPAVDDRGVIPPAADPQLWPHGRWVSTGPGSILPSTSTGMRCTPVSSCPHRPDRDTGALQRRRKLYRWVARRLWRSLGSMAPIFAWRDPGFENDPRSRVSAPQWSGRLFLAGEMTGCCGAEYR